MSTKALVLAGPILIGLVLFGCGDDDEGVADSGPRDAATIDAQVADAGADDAGGEDAGADAGAEDAGTDSGTFEAFSSTLALTTAQEVPLCSAAGGSAMGSGMVTIDAANTMVTVIDLTYSGLSGPPTGGHIHAGAPGVAGPVVLSFGSDLSSPINRTFTSADYPSPAPTGAPATWADFLAAMRDGQAYVNIHTADCMPGEIRDQIE